MNGVVEQGGEAAKAAITSLATQPVMLMIVLLNMVFAASAGYFLTILVERYYDTHRFLLERCFEQHKVIYAPREGGGP